MADFSAAQIDAWTTLFMDEFHQWWRLAGAAGNSEAGSSSHVEPPPPDDGGAQVALCEICCQRPAVTVRRFAEDDAFAVCVPCATVARTEDS